MKGSVHSPIVEDLQNKAIDHLYKWRQKLHKSLMRSNRIQEVTLEAAEDAHKEINQLMRAGYQAHEAEEVVLQEYILVPPS